MKYIFMVAFCVLYSALISWQTSILQSDMFELQKKEKQLREWIEEVSQKSNRNRFNIYAVEEYAQTLSENYISDRKADMILQFNKKLAQDVMRLERKVNKCQKYQ